MTDEKDKINTNDELVKQFFGNNNTSSFPTNSNQPPPNLPGIIIDTKQPSFSSSTPTTPKPSTDDNLDKSNKSNSSFVTKSSTTLPEPPKPDLSATSASTNTEPNKNSNTLPPPPLSPIKNNPSQEYKSSIRTMEDDINSLKTGQKPAGLDISRKVTPEVPRFYVPNITNNPNINKPEETTISKGPVKSLELGKAEKTSPLPSVPYPQKTSESPKLQESQVSISVPKENKSRSKMFFYLIIIIFLIGGGLGFYWVFNSFYLNKTLDQNTLSPSSSPELTSGYDSLEKIFNFESRELYFEFENEGKSFYEDLNYQIEGSELPYSDAKFFKIKLVLRKIEQENLSIKEENINFLDFLSLNKAFYPDDLKNYVAESVLMEYNQSEFFDQEHVSPDPTVRLVWVAKVTNSDNVKQIMEQWETNMADSLKDMFRIDPLKQASNIFLENNYKNILIKYKNFPLPDKSIDYAIVKARNQNYLIISESRESMYSTIDWLVSPQ